MTTFESSFNSIDFLIYHYSNVLYNTMTTNFLRIICSTVINYTITGSLNLHAALNEQFVK